MFGRERGVEGVLWLLGRGVSLFDENGLAIHDGLSWNIVGTLKILWLLLAHSSSMWVEVYILKGRSL